MNDDIAQRYDGIIMISPVLKHIIANLYSTVH